MVMLQNAEIMYVNHMQIVVIKKIEQFQILN